MYDNKCVYGILTNYRISVFLKMERDPRSQKWGLQYSPMIRSDDLDVTLRECLLFLLSKIRVNSIGDAKSHVPLSEWADVPKESNAAKATSQGIQAHSQGQNQGQSRSIGSAGNMEQLERRFEGMNVSTRPPGTNTRPSEMNVPAGTRSSARIAAREQPKKEEEDPRRRR